MLSISSLGASLLALCATTLALPSTSTSLEARNAEVCKNSPTSRDCWDGCFTVNTDHYEKFPDTGKTRTYYLDVTNQKGAPDGFTSDMMLFNGQYPGPPIVADWGDTLQITVKNSMTNGNGTSIHWHGLRQLNSNQMDGTNGITECPIAPGQTKVYTFKATEYGTSWYHSHFSVQYGNGLVGPIIINGPASANYDIDLGALPMTDWFHDDNFYVLAVARGPPLSQNILVNGTGVYNGAGKFGSTKITPGKKHLLRLVNTGVNNYLHVSLDNHPFTVIRNDFVDIKPFVTTSLVLSVGQRYDVIIDADQVAGNYWFRTTTGGGLCDGPNEKAASNDTRSYIFSYEGTTLNDPISKPYTMSTGCQDETNLVPIVPFTVPAPAALPYKLDLVLDTSRGASWKVNGVPLVIDWKTPTLTYVAQGNYTLPASDNGLVINDAGWSYWYILNDTPLPHPIHLHGHDFFVLADGPGNATDATNYTLVNPIRRDTHTVDAFGHLIIAFVADNPGAWLMHCHIPFHISGGLGVQFVERPKEIIGLLGDLTGFNNGCASWNTYAAAENPVIPQGDSGL